MAGKSRTEMTFVTLLCAFAAGRVFVYSAAFPLFNNMDELDRRPVFRLFRGEKPAALSR